MDILLMAAITLTVLVIYYSWIQRERILLLTEQIDALKWQLTSQQQRAEALCASITAHLAAKQAILDEMDALERTNNFLRHKRSGRNGEIMRHSVYGHHRGHSA